MITQMTGVVTEVLEDRITLTVGGIGYEVLIPLAVQPRLAERLGQPDTVLYTLEYLEGTAGKGNLIPRLVGFPSRADREFFELLTTVDGIGTRKALKALSAPSADIARAVEDRDAARLSALPEIGKRTAEKIIAALHGKLGRFAWSEGSGGAAGAVGSNGSGSPTRPAARGPSLPSFAADARAVLLQLGEKPTEADDLIARALRGKPDIANTDGLIREVYRLKPGRA